MRNQSINNNVSQQPALKVDVHSSVGSEFVVIRVKVTVNLIEVGVGGW